MATTVMHTKIHTMLVMQDSINSKVNPHWRAANHAWYRAIWTECAELLDHYGWKWWQQQQPDQQQVQLEVVDIWHFVMSDLLLKDTSDSAIAEVFITPPPADNDLRKAIEAMALSALQTHAADLKTFTHLMHCAGLSLDTLFIMYIGKNTLNAFRQDHGYKEGRYQKVWDGKEDNAHLADILAQLDADMAGLSAAVYQRLEQAYPG